MISYPKERIVLELECRSIYMKINVECLMIAIAVKIIETIFGNVHKNVVFVAAFYLSRN